ncbi:protein naked cuticle [Contarinia nasturtii]|uniref:protein naked cuticle n=1 Tax=Contarinia nasturtii TaxID=265458 RepID=UPI0012D4AECC|nr:protein naked cuticle [Contarinia nasturtii]
MAGNIVKWWKHKILGGYKQFSVLQECATDSEELIYPIRAPSSCSAPPDLLLTGDRNKDAKVQTSTPRNDAISSDRVLLEEFTCDVSVEGGGKSTQPLQFSFTFYDLDGHHGKITKDDIAGIVYTIYESIGKSVVVPHCGSKTINVRLTVSPDSKSKSADSQHSVKKSTKRQRIKSRRLFKCDDDEEGSGSGCFDTNQETNKTTQLADELLQHTQSVGIQSTPIIGTEKSDGIVTEKNQPEQKDNRPQKDTVDGRIGNCCANESAKNHHRQQKSSQTTENIYESAPISNENSAPTSKSKCDKVTLNNNNSCCQDCRVTNQLYQIETVPISKPCARRIGRKSRSRKQKNSQDSHPATRIRSLSVGNENSFRNSNGDASSGASGKDRNDECLNNLRRNDLIDIIRESMEKSRLCFQSNGKTNVSPSKHHRHRSYTISSKMTPIDPHSNETTAIHTHNASKANWCGYDSMLHAKICSTNNIISNPVLAAHTSKLLLNYNSNHNNSTPNCNNSNNNNINNVRNSRSRHRHHTNEFPISASPQVQGYTKLMSMQNSKLNTALLSQLNPQLTQEQKLTRTISHVEKWLADDQTMTAAATSNILTSNNLLDISKNVNCKENNLYKDAECLNNVNAIGATDKFKENEKLAKKLNDVGSPSKKTFNKEILLTRKTPKSSLSSSQRNSSNSDSHGKGTTNVTTGVNTTVPEQKENIVEYASIPIVDPSQSECENLLRASSDDSSQIGMTDNASLTTIHRYVHIHHHYYHH